MCVCGACVVFEVIDGRMINSRFQDTFFLLRPMAGGMRPVELGEFGDF